MESDDEYVPCDSPMDARSFVRSRIVDADEDEDVRIHLASLSGDYERLKALLKEEESRTWVNHRVRPFQASPLRLSVTGGSVKCIPLLVKGGALINLEDIKGQTPLFVATSLHNLTIMEILLRNGANPEGSHLNRGTPLVIAVRDGFAEGVKLLLRYGANPEPFSQLTSCVPCWPLQHAVVYSNFSCFLALLQGGAVANIHNLYPLMAQVIRRRLSIPYTILKYAKDRPEFVRLYHECGGDLSQVEPSDPLCLENSKAKAEMFKLQGLLPSLQCYCRNRIIFILAKTKGNVEKLEIPSTLHSFLRFKDYDKYMQMIPKHIEE